LLSAYLKGNIQFLDEVSSWEESIKVAAEPLLGKGSITPKYIQDMINNVNINGPYIVIVPGIAMPHAKNDGGVLKTGISLLKLKKPVSYPQGKEVQIIIVLAAENSSGHLDLISDLSSVLIDEDVMDTFRNSQSEEEIIKLLESVD
jgi:PTS system mannitol-specific IIA component